MGQRNARLEQLYFCLCNLAWDRRAYFMHHLSFFNTLLTYDDHIFEMLF